MYAATPRGFPRTSRSARGSPRRTWTRRARRRAPPASGDQWWMARGLAAKVVTMGRDSKTSKKDKQRKRDKGHKQKKERKKLTKERKKLKKERKQPRHGDGKLSASQLRVAETALAHQPAAKDETQTKRSPMLPMRPEEAAKQAAEEAKKTHLYHQYTSWQWSRIAK
eukprot:scaffold705_cov402-Prasinococcus_capsulatus_cf.AAC.32